ncbi:MAG: cache domain-containing protein [Deltaproteobacteria bacterium]|nr:cache domain-containing protein [Deltaproteobacteria bacterium]
MTASKREKQLFTVGRIFFLLIVIPLALVSVLLATSILKVGDVAEQSAVVVMDQKYQGSIKVRAIALADEVASFLTERQDDLMVATILPTDGSVYKNFLEKKSRSIWEKRDGKLTRVLLPLYQEMALINPAGQEVIRVANGKVVPAKELRNVADIRNTEYLSEDYFAKSKKLNRGEIYISPLTGWYVDRTSFEKGKRFAGIYRIASPVFDRNGFAGVLVMTLDARHLMQMTDRIVPTQSDYVFEADPSTGNYAYMVDNRGFVISHPADYHVVGLDKAGKQVLPLTKENTAIKAKEGTEVLNLRLMGFIDAELQKVALEAAAGKTGIRTYSFAGHTKLVAYAPIKFYCVGYSSPEGFGWIGMGVDVDKFNSLGADAAKQIREESRSWASTIIVIIVISVLLLFGIAAILARGIMRSVNASVPEEAKNPLSEDDEDEN